MELQRQEKKKKKKGARRNQGSKSLGSSSPVLSHQVQHHTPGHIWEVNEIMRRLLPPKPLIDRKPFHC